MKNLNFKKLAATALLGLMAVLSISINANAQNNRDNQRQVEKVRKANQKAEKARIKAEQARVRLDRLQRERTIRNNGNWARDGNRGNSGNYTNYRVYRSGRYYTTDNRGAELLRNAVNQGYQQGFAAGRSDRSSRRRNSWSSNTTYREGTYGYENYVDRNQYQYYFQRGFQKGYDDGYNSRSRYGTQSNGNVNILGVILGQILNIQNY
ncbi:hypothetical protein BH10ACI2_BH10ACI2_06600 [soil metagenome]